MEEKKREAGERKTCFLPHPSFIVVRKLGSPAKIIGQKWLRLLYPF
jgi:hypothetical protein